MCIGTKQQNMARFHISAMNQTLLGIVFHISLRGVAAVRDGHWTDFHLNYFQIMINIDEPEHSNCSHSNTFSCYFMHSTPPKIGVATRGSQMVCVCVSHVRRILFASDFSEIIRRERAAQLCDDKFKMPFCVIRGWMLPIAADAASAIFALCHCCAVV